MAKHRTYSTEFKRQVAQEYIAGGDSSGFCAHSSGLSALERGLCVT